MQDGKGLGTESSESKNKDGPWPEPKLTLCYSCKFHDRGVTRHPVCPECGDDVMMIKKTAYILILDAKFPNNVRKASDKSCSSE
eukprot:g42050.t1